MRALNSIQGVNWFLFVSILTQGCGVGKGIVEKVSLVSKQEGSVVWVEMTADLKQNGFQLPAVTLPIKDPKNPSRELGEISTSAYQVITRVNATEIIKVPILDGGRLPSGAAIPVRLDAGAVPMSVPVFNSKSRVYFAVTGDQLMVGVAVSILKEDRLNLPLNIFFPFQMSPQLRGTAGFFLGDVQGIGIFALGEKAAAGGTATIASVSSVVKNAVVQTAVAAPRIRIKEEPLTQKKLNQLFWTSESYGGELRID